MVDSALKARSAFRVIHGGAPDGRPPGVIAEERNGLSVATVMSRRDRLDSLAGRIRERYGIELPRGNFRAAAYPVSFVGVGPETWLASQEQGGNAFALSLRSDLSPLASVSDQTDAYAVLRLSGPRLRDALAKLIAIDLHPRIFKSGDAASTVASHIGVTLWRMEDDSDGFSVFEIAIFRSFAGAFWHSLGESAAEFGIRGSAS